MRLIRIGEQQSQVADDIRAALTALGTGSATHGGIALLDVTTQGRGPFLDAVCVLPHGVLIIAAVDLPGPALHLEAPLHGQWKADRWALVGPKPDTNPGTQPLESATLLTEKLRSVVNGAHRIATVLAVGPYVDTVSSPEHDLSQPVRVIHPKPAALRAAIAELIPTDRPALSVEHARAVVRAVDPAAPIQPDDALLDEGFTAAHTRIRADRPAHAPEVRSNSRRGSDWRWVPVAAVGILVVLLVAAVVVATTAAGAFP